MSIPAVIVKPGEADRIIAGHPWVYGNSIQRITSPPTDGEVVHVKDHRARFLGTGIYNSRSKIVIRMIDHDRAELDRAFFRARITAARAHRRKWLPTATSYRLLQSECDVVTALNVDGDILAVLTDHLLSVRDIVDDTGERHLNVTGQVGFRFFGQLILDCLHRTEKAMTQAHAFKAAELCLRAQLAARKIA